MWSWRLAGTRARAVQPASAIDANMWVAVSQSTRLCSISTVSQEKPARAMKRVAVILPSDNQVPTDGSPFLSARLTGFVRMESSIDFREDTRDTKRIIARGGVDASERYCSRATSRPIRPQTMPMDRARAIQRRLLIAGRAARSFCVASGVGEKSGGSVPTVAMSPSLSSSAGTLGSLPAGAAFGFSMGQNGTAGTAYGATAAA